MAAEFHDGCWTVKFIIVIALYLASFQIPEEFYQDYYIPIAKYTSVAFLIYISLVTIIFAYRYNDLLVKNYEKDESDCSSIILLGNLSFFLLIDIGFIIYYTQNFLYKNLPFEFITFISIILVYLFTVIKIREDSSLLTTSFVVLYILYLQWSVITDMSEID